MYWGAPNRVRRATAEGLWWPGAMNRSSREHSEVEFWPGALGAHRWHTWLILQRDLEVEYSSKWHIGLVRLCTRPVGSNGYLGLQWSPQWLTGVARHVVGLVVHWTEQVPRGKARLKQIPLMAACPLEVRWCTGPVPCICRKHISNNLLNNYLRGFGL